ncbi:hypothetical protein VTJ49DRAFT_5660 [Mycothermus thermophilus]|uniref:Dihydroneopterin aldolase/epimerase domain-containing protein n=1 Tax=Humicola insolens TaxID=85995 RepID=A0ABR3VLL4_HUMIN
MAPPLITHARLLALCPDPPATVAVRNLQTTLRRSGLDAWGREGRTQPCLVSVEVRFLQGFGLTARGDRLGRETVHYGLLSKAVLGCVERFEATEEGSTEECGVKDVLAAVWARLTGLTVDGEAYQTPTANPLLDLETVRFLSVSIALPKASLLGEGVKLTASAVFDSSRADGPVEARAAALEICRLRVPTLVGVNDNEREAKQFVVATVMVERFAGGGDCYTDVERNVVRTMEASSFETLEALGERLAETVLASPGAERTWQVGIRMEKPTAVPMAECPIVVVRATGESLQALKSGEEAAGTSTVGL